MSLLSYWWQLNKVTRGGGIIPKIFARAGVCDPTRISDKTLCHFQYPISDLIEKSIPHFRSLKLVHGSNIRPQLTICVNIWEGLTWICRCWCRKNSSLRTIYPILSHSEKPVLFQTKLGENLYPFSDQIRSKNPYSLGSHIPICLNHKRKCVSISPRLWTQA